MREKASFLLKCMFLGTELILFLAFLYLDISGKAALFGITSSILKYCGIFLCLIYSCRKGCIQEIRLGLAGTLLADYFLLFTGKWIPGVFCFILVQLCYRRALGKRMISGLTMTFIISACLSVIFLILRCPVDVLFVLVTIYVPLLVTNTVFALRSGNRLFGIGMCLFLLCDIQVGIYNAAEYLTFNESLTGIAEYLYQFVSVGIWACYLPAKTLIAEAGHRKYWNFC